MLLKPKLRAGFGRDPEAGNHQFVFIGGLHRSGTSVLFQCLREHPLISGFRNTGVPEDEGQHLQSLYPPAYVYGGPGQFGFQPEAHMTENSELVGASNRSRLVAEWEPHWDLDRPILLEKSPPNLIRARFLQALFPDARFIMVLRDPIAVAYATRKWSNTSLASLVEHWLVCHEQFERDKEHLEHVLVLRYEEFVRSPQSTLDMIYSFLGVRSHPNQIEVRSNVNEKYLQRWAEDQHETLSDDEDSPELIRTRFEKRVAAFGYSLDV